MSKTNQLGYEISYHVKGIGIASMTEIVYAESSHDAVQIIKARYKGNEFISEPHYTLNNTRDESQDGNIFKLIFFGTLGLVIVYFLYVLVVNIFNFNKISNFDFGLYFNNIKSFYTEGEFRTANKKINMNITAPDEFVGDVLVPKNKIFIYEGSKNAENNATLIALSYYDNNKHIYGYYTQNQKNNALQMIDKQIDKRIKEAIEKMFQEELSKKVDLVQVKGKKVDDLESNGYNIVQHISSDDMTFLYKDEYKNEVEIVEDKYYSDDNYQKLYTKIGEKYLKL